MKVFEEFLKCPICGENTNANAAHIIHSNYEYEKDKSLTAKDLVQCQYCNHLFIHYRAFKYISDFVSVD